MPKIQTYQETDLGKEIKILGKVTTLGEGRFIITIAKKDNDIIKEFKGDTVVLTIKRALED
jgi:hypothetical protein